jgi:glyoxylase-like metal-dependent hydrolase (beta-lactamase superfamily II)
MPELVGWGVPGHTPKSTSRLVDNTYLISGDAIFILSIGWPDLGGKAVEWAKLIINTIKTHIAALDDSIVVLSGHYMEWTEMNTRRLFDENLGNVRNRNADICGISDEKGFIKFIQDSAVPFLQRAAPFQSNRC